MQCGFLPTNRYESDLLNGVLYAILGEDSEKISEVKFGGWKNNIESDKFETDAHGPAVPADYFQPPNLTSNIFVVSWPIAFSTSIERSDFYLFGS